MHESSCRIRREAEADVQAAYEYLEEIRAGLGKKFLARLRETLDLIETFPKLHGVIWQQVRATRIKKFRFLVVYYEVFPERTEVFAVLHGAQNPSAWKKRLSSGDSMLDEKLYRTLYRIRRVEEEIARVYPQDKIKSPVHLSIGQEAISVAVCEALAPHDIVFGTYRGHALTWPKAATCGR